MEGKRWAWMVMVVIAMVMVVENGKMCRAAADMEDAKEKTGEAMQSVEDKAGSWGGWVKEKFTGKWSLGENVKDTGKGVMQSMSSTTSDASKYVSDKAHDAKEKVKESTK